MQQLKLPRQYSFLLLYNLWWSNSNCGGFCLHLLVFPFVYQFKSRIGVLVHSSFANDENYNNFSASFQILFVVVFTWKRMQLLHLSLVLYRTKSTWLLLHNCTKLGSTYFYIECTAEFFSCKLNLIYVHIITYYNSSSWHKFMKNFCNTAK